MKRQMLTIFLTLAAPLAAMSDEAMFCANTARTGQFNTAPLTDIPDVAWENGQHGSFSGCVVATSSSLYLITNNKELLSLDLATGATNWSQQLTFEGVGANPSVDEASAIVITGTGDTGVNAYHAVTGAPLWSITTRGRVTGSPAIAGDGNTYFTDEGGSVYSVDTSTGSENWVVNVGPVIVGSPALSAATSSLITATTSGNVISLDLSNGSIQWSTFIHSGIRGTTPVADGLVLVTNCIDRLVALDESTGTIRWEAAVIVNASTTPAVADGRVYVVDIVGHIRALDLVTGNQLWEASFGDRAIAPPVLAGTTLYVPCSSGELLAFDGVTGQRLWSFNTEALLFSQPAVRDGRVYLSTVNAVYALEPQTPRGRSSWFR